MTTHDHSPPSVIPDDPRDATHARPRFTTCGHGVPVGSLAEARSHRASQPPHTADEPTLDKVADWLADAEAVRLLAVPPPVGQSPRQGLTRERTSHMLIQQPGWMPRDDALLHTCRVAHLMITKGDLATIPEVVAPFAPQVTGERLWSAGPFTLSKWGLPDMEDGPENQPPPGVAGWAVNKAVNTALAYANAASHRFLEYVVERRAWRDAQATATPRWVPFSSGTLFISAYGFHLYTPQVYQWPWEGITSAKLMGPGLLHLTGNNGQGLVSWLLTSDWAELMFVTWALERHPRHPDLFTGWLPPGWIAHAQRWGHTVPMPLTTSP